MKNNLLVYDASAGSGKTYKLSEKFSDYLLEEFKRGNKDAYRFVMAVTFTNKATFEMKSRIISRLYDRAKGISKEERKLSEEDRKNSMLILKNLVHDYTMFRVSTIDSFFQKVLKAFAVEMGSSSSFDTTLDQDSAIEAAMDSLYSKLDTDEKLRAALENISLARLEDEKYWNWRDDLLAICKRVLDSEYQNFKPSCLGSESIGDIEKIFEKQQKELDEIFAKQVIGLYDSIIKEARDLNLKGLNGKKDLRKFLEDCLASDKKFIDRNNNTIIRNYPIVLDTWKNDPQQLNKNGSLADLEAIDNKVGGYIHSIKDLYGKYYTKYKSLGLIRLNIRESSLLDAVNKELEEYLSREQLTLLSSAPKILADLIDSSPTPFVYDKIGVCIDHYLLDEFQDTSVDQWKNFKPLLEESLSRNEYASTEGLESMLVGDVKQSIYRFRDGKWELFKDTVKEEFKDNYHKEPLDVNHRSLKNIVEFNNLLFSSVEKDKWFGEEADNALPGALVGRFIDNLDNKTGGQKDLSGTIADIYRKSAQHIKPEYEIASHKGVVHIISCNYDEKKSKVSKDEFILWDLVRKINYLTKELGFLPKDIAILADKNSQAGLIANYLVNNKINIVSGESLKLDSNKVVSLAIELMRKLVNPNDKGLDALIRLYGIELERLDLLDLASEEGKQFTARLRSCNTLYQMCKLILRTFFKELEDGDLAFAKAFLDRVLDYSQTNGTSISDFLKWWDLSKDKFFIPEPSSSQAVQIMTMHKAKGLGFRVVFIPFLRDNMISVHHYPVPEKVWVALDKDKLGYDGPLLLPFKCEMEDSFYRDYYYKELMERSVDNLNLAYVSFTRAKERLYIYAKSSGEPINSISAALNAFLPEISGEGKLFKVCPETLEEGETVTDYVLGNDAETPFEKDCSRSTDYAGSIEASMVLTDPSTINLRGVYDEDDNIMRGVLYHELFSYIDGEGNSEGPIELKAGKAVDKFLKRNPGSLIGDDADSLKREVLDKIFSVRGKGWFDEGRIILGEQSILSNEGTYRPDRIILPLEGKNWAEVVDYKFGTYEEGSKKHNSYVRQVKNYMRLLRNMGYSNVKGWLWYVLEDKVAEILNN